VSTHSRHARRRTGPDASTALSASACQAGPPAQRAGIHGAELVHCPAGSVFMRTLRTARCAHACAASQATHRDGDGQFQRVQRLRPQLRRDASGVQATCVRVNVLRPKYTMHTFALGACSGLQQGRQHAVPAAHAPRSVLCEVCRQPPRRAAIAAAAQAWSSQATPPSAPSRLHRRRRRRRRSTRRRTRTSPRPRGVRTAACVTCARRTCRFSSTISPLHTPILSASASRPSTYAPSCWLSTAATLASNMVAALLARGCAPQARRGC
jgi:hypothetical protein